MFANKQTNIKMVVEE